MPKGNGKGHGRGKNKHPQNITLVAEPGTIDIEGSMARNHVLQIGQSSPPSGYNFVETFSSGDFNKLNNEGYYFWSGSGRRGGQTGGFLVDSQGSPSAGLIENLAFASPPDDPDWHSPYDSYPWTPPQSESPDATTCVEDASSNWDDSNPTSSRYVLNNCYPPYTALKECGMNWDYDLPEMWWSCWMRVPYNHWHPTTTANDNNRKFFTFCQDGYSDVGAGSNFIMDLRAYPDDTQTRYAEKIKFDWTSGYTKLGDKTNSYGWLNWSDADDPDIFIRPGNGPSVVNISGVEDHGRWMRLIIQARLCSAAACASKVSDGTLKAWMYYDGDTVPSVDNPTLDYGEYVAMLPANILDPTGTVNESRYQNPTQGTPITGFRWGWTLGNWNGVNAQSRQQEWLISEVRVSDNAAFHWS